MTYHQVGALTICFLFLIYFIVELGWGGGNPKDKDHHRPPGDAM